MSIREKMFLIGTEGSKRKEYFEKAAAECGAAVEFTDWREVEGADLTGGVVKIDPPSYTTSDLFEMEEQVSVYRSQLQMLGRRDCVFLNTPEGIERVLDKFSCKKRLSEHGIAVTEMLTDRVMRAELSETGDDVEEQLEEMMRRRRVSSVFIKPSCSSGAAGVVAYRRFRGSGKEIAYTSCCVHRGELVNTKRMYRLEKREEIRPLLQAVFSLGVVVERWHPKASYRGKSYDLRVVWQFGEIAYMVARQSGGPITNLHLNNSPLDWRELGLTGQTIAEITQLCGEAMKLFPGLCVAGIDVLLEKGTLRPRIIEINGQGDLIYQDIYRDNTIYKRQIEEMRRLWKQSI